ncbi:MAG: HDOD domain-containing protein [bacterium]
MNKTSNTDPSSEEGRFEQKFETVDRNHPLMGMLMGKGRERLGELNLPSAPAKLPPEPVRPKFSSMEEIVAKVKVPAIPHVLMDLQKIMNDPDSSASDLAAVISRDPKLTAVVLRIVNSAMFSFPAPVETVSRAVAVLGIRQLSTLASGTLLLNLFTNTYGDLDLERFWMHSIGCGILARNCAAHAQLQDPERYFVAGLLHDIGWLALAASFPEISSYILQSARHHNIPLHRAERNFWGFDHATLGGFLLRKWNFPLLLVGGVAFHHNPEKGKKWDEPSILHLANTMANAVCLGISNDLAVQDLHTPSLERCSMTEADAEAILDASFQEIQELTKLLIPNSR